jgi:hypothetical protein
MVMQTSKGRIKDLGYGISMGCKDIDEAFD